MFELLTPATQMCLLGVFETFLAFNILREDGAFPFAALPLWLHNAVPELCPHPRPLEAFLPLYGNCSTAVLGTEASKLNPY